MPQILSMTAVSSDTRLWSTPIAVRLGIPKLVGLTRDWTSIRIGRVPSMLGTTTDPAAPSGRSARKKAEGLATSTRPVSRISKTPISWVGPKRFLIPRMTR